MRVLFGSGDNGHQMAAATDCSRAVEPFTGVLNFTLQRAHRYLAVWCFNDPITHTFQAITWLRQWNLQTSCYRFPGLISSILQYVVCISI